MFTRVVLFNMMMVKHEDIFRHRDLVKSVTNQEIYVFIDTVVNLNSRMEILGLYHIDGGGNCYVSLDCTY